MDSWAVKSSDQSAPFKSAICKPYQKWGTCGNGINCRFAHISSELVRDPRHSDAVVVETSEGGPCNAYQCYWYSSGKACPHGQICQFVGKSDHDVRRAAGGDRTGSDVIVCGGRDTREDTSTKSVFYKTKLCIMWEKFRRCSRGATCKYAHGERELRRMSSSAEQKDVYVPRTGSSKMGNKIDATEKLRDTKHFLNWDIKKMSQIYADWIDDASMSS